MKTATTDEALSTLRDEALTAGDTEAANTCTLALDGDDEARALCTEWISNAAAMCD